jgi:hypothetical protein
MAPLQGALCRDAHDPALRLISEAATSSDNEGEGSLRASLPP